MLKWVPKYINKTKSFPDPSLAFGRICMLWDGVPAPSATTGKDLRVILYILRRV